MDGPGGWSDAAASVDSQPADSGSSGSADQPQGSSQPGGQAPTPSSGGQTGIVSNLAAQAKLAGVRSGSPGQPETTGQADTGLVPSQSPPLMLRPVHTSPIARMVDKVADFLAGSTGTKVYEDQDGNKHVYHPLMPRGQQWARIGAEALAGAGRGLAAGKGAGNMGKALAAGVEGGQQDAQQRQQQAKEMTDAERQQMLDNANNQMLRMKMAEESWKATRLQVEATEHDVEFSQGQEDRLTKEGGVLLGTAVHPGDIGEILKVNPDVMRDMVKRHTIEILPHVNPDGSRGGIRVFKMPDGYRQQMLPAGQDFPTFNEVTGDYDWHKSGDPMTTGQRDDYWNNAGATSLAYRSKQQEIQNKADEEKDRKTRLDALPSEIARNWATAHEAEAKTLETQMQQQPGGLIDMIGQGRAGPGHLAFLAARKPELLDQVAQKYPGFDQTKVDAYANAYKEFTGGKVATQLNALGAATKHLDLLSRLNTNMARVKKTDDFQAYETALDTVAPELARFYGDETIPGIAGQRKTLGTTIGSRQKAIDTKIDTMVDKYFEFRQQWKNASPSAAYEARMPDISDDAKQAMAKHNKRFADWYEKQPQPQQQPGAATTSASGQTTQQPSGGGTIVSLAAARGLPANKGKTDAQITSDIQAHGHTVGP